MPEARYSRSSLPLAVLAERLAVCRLGADEAVPVWATASRVLSAVVRTREELSVLTAERDVPPDAPAERGYRALRVEEALPFHLVGVLASLAQPLAEAGLAILAISTYDTDYVLVKEHDLSAAVAVLRRAGHVVSGA